MSLDTRITRYTAIPHEELHELSHVLGTCYAADGCACFPGPLSVMIAQAKLLMRERVDLFNVGRLQLKKRWAEEDGVVLWWLIGERHQPIPVYVGKPTDIGFPAFPTHWSRVPTNTWAEPGDDI